MAEVRFRRAYCLFRPSQSKAVLPMKLCRFNGGRLGLVEGEAVTDVSAALQALPSQRYPFPSHDVLIAQLNELRPGIVEAARTGQKHAASAVHYDPPVANPGKIIGAPINYKAHAQESAQDSNIGHGRAITTIGDWGMFLKAGTSLIGVSDEIVLRFPERRNDHEVELAVVIGKTCRQVKAADAMAHVAAYSLSLDMTLRGPEFQCFRKSIDSYAVLGPWLVTADEVPDPGQLDLWLQVNGQTRQQANTRDLIFDVPRLIEFASSFYTLQPGDVIMTGTPEGVGPVVPGDWIEAGVQGLGSLAMRVASQYA
jgi:2-keto-4-pentenoate hydratase/2-oxohepta-3-ene-1,7-dioic acid hydratase in catechol pathway